LSRRTLARAAGEVGPDDVVVMAQWTGRDMPASRWVGSTGREWPVLDALLGDIRRVSDGADDRVGEDASPDPGVAAYLASLSDAQLVAVALGVELSY
jgi:hypothetical protein